jgi:hypothetical protein
MGSPAIWFSDGPFFSQAVYSCGSVQSSVGQYFQATVRGQVRGSLAAPSAWIAKRQANFDFRPLITEDCFLHKLRGCNFYKLTGWGVAARHPP